MKVSLASAMGTCFGVRDAIDLAMSPEFHSDLTIVGQLVHNPQVSESLKQNGVSLVQTKTVGLLRLLKNNQFPIMPLLASTIMHTVLIMLIVQTQ